MDLAHRHDDATAAILDVGGPARERRHRCDRAGRVGRLLEHDRDLLSTNPPLQLGRGAALDHLTAVDHRDLICEAVSLLEVLRGEQRGHAAAHQLVDEIPHRDAAARVETGRGLVEEEDRGLADEAHRDVEPAPHASRVGARDPVGGTTEVEALQQVVGAAACVAFGLVEEPSDVHEVLTAGEAFVDCRVLPGEPDPGTRLPRVLHDVDAVDDGGALVGLEQRREDAHRRRLAGAVRAEHPQDARRARPAGRHPAGPLWTRSASSVRWLRRRAWAQHVICTPALDPRGRRRSPDVQEAPRKSVATASQSWVDRARDSWSTRSSLPWNIVV